MAGYMNWGRTSADKTERRFWNVDSISILRRTDEHGNDEALVFIRRTQGAPGSEHTENCGILITARELNAAGLEWSK